MESVVEINDLKKSFKGFGLDIPDLKIPKGFATALIGENGAGKTTLLNCIAGVRLDYKGHIRYFEKWQDEERDREESGVRENIGYLGSGLYFLPHWKIDQIEELSGILFEHFHPERYRQLCRDLAIVSSETSKKKVSELSDGNRMKLMLAAVFARDTSLLTLDEPASPLDPVMRERLCEMIREYLEDGNGEKSVLFSTHNISDMENVTDYAVIIEQGRVAEQGFVEDLKEKYILVKGEAEDAEAAKPVLYSISESRYGFEGLCLAEDLDRLTGIRVNLERPSLFQISVAVMKRNSLLKRGMGR